MTEQIKSELYTEIKNILTYSEFDFLKKHCKDLLFIFLICLQKIKL